MGKSSLMVRAAQRFRQNRAQVVVLDLTSVGQNLSPEQWYDGLMVSLGRQLKLEDELDEFWLNQGRISPVQRFFMAIRDIVLPKREGRVVFFVDEIDAVLSLPFSADEFFAAVRECYTRRTLDPAMNRVVFCLLGVATPGDLIQDTRTSPFNIGRRIVLNDFTVEETLPLSGGWKAYFPDEKQCQGVVSRIHYWTHGHPYLTQRICRTLYDRLHHYSEKDLQRPHRIVDGICRELFLGNRAEEKDDNLIFVRERLLRAGHDTAGMLSFYREVRAGKKVKDDFNNPMVHWLGLSGITRPEGEYLKVRNRIYDHVFDLEWIREVMPDAEARRQRQAYLRGITRAATWATLALAIMAMLALYALRQNQIAQAEARYARQISYASDMNLAQQALAAGNLGKARRLLNRNLPRLRGSLLRFDDRMGGITEDRGMGNVSDSLDTPTGWRKDLWAQDLRGWEWRYLKRRSEGNEWFQLADYQGAGIMQVGLSWDNRVVSVASLNLGLENQLIELWDTQSLEKKDLLTSGQVGAHDFFADRPWMVFGVKDPSFTGFRIWNYETQETIQLVAEDDAPRRLVVSPDGSWVAWMTFSGWIKLWDVENRQVVWALDLQTRSTSIHFGALDFSPDGTGLSIGKPDGKLCWVQVSTGEIIKEFQAHEGGVTAIAFSPKGQYLASSSGYSENSIVIWKYPEGEKVKTLGAHLSFVTSLAFSNKDPILISGSADQSIRFWNTETWEADGMLKGHEDEVYSLVWGDRLKALVSGAKDGQVFFWHPDDRRPQAPYRTLAERVVGRAAFSPDGKRMASLNAEGQLRVWSLETLEPEAAYTESLSSGTSFFFGGVEDALFWVNDFKGTLEKWSFQSGSHQSQETPGSAGSLVMARKVGARQEIVTIDRNQLLQVWFSEAGPMMYQMGLPQGNFSTFDVDLKNALLVLGDSTGSVQVWDIRTGMLRTTFRGHHRKVVGSLFTPDGSRLVTAGEEGMVKIWDAKTFQRITILKGHLKSVHSIAISPDGLRLATGSGNQEAVKIWDLETYQELLTLEGSGAIFNYLEFSPDGNTLVARNDAGMMHLWYAGREGRDRPHGSRSKTPPKRPDRSVN